jgi:hypothetical protein
MRLKKNTAIDCSFTAAHFARGDEPNDADYIAAQAISNIIDAHVQMNTCPCGECEDNFIAKVITNRKHIKTWLGA